MFINPIDLMHPIRSAIRPATTLGARHAPRRREFLAILGAGVALAACGRAEEEELSPSTSNAVVAAAKADTVPDDDGSALVGVVYGVVEADDQKLAAGGVRKLGQSAPLQQGDAMMIGSNTKAMTAAISGRLIEKGKIDWNTKIAEAIPSLGAIMSNAYANITLEQLLAHRGGMMAFTGEDDIGAFETYLQQFDGVLPQDERGRRLFFLEWVLRQEPPRGVFPGQTYFYSNAGYALVGAMLEAATGQTYEALWHSEVGQPLGMEAVWTRPELTGQAAAWGHEGPPGQVAIEPTPDPQDQLWYDVIIPAGLITLSPIDYATWLRWHVRALRGEATPLSPGYLQRLKSIPQNDYAVGWVSTILNGRPCIGHDGSWFGFMALAYVELTGRRAAFGMTNTNWIDAKDNSWVLTRMNLSVTSMDNA